MKVKLIDIARDFSPYPAGRYVADGPASGQAFRDGLLVPALNENDRVRVEFDGAIGYGSSFLEEAFGGLVREHRFSKSDLKVKLELKSEDGSLIRAIWKYIDGAVAK